MSESYKADGVDAAMGCFIVMLDVPYRVWVASLLWGWFVVPLGVPSLNFAQMLGVLIVLGILLRYRAPTETAKDAPEWYGKAAAPLIMTTISLLFGILLRVFTL